MLTCGEPLLLFLGQFLIRLPRVLTRFARQLLRDLIVLARNAPLIGRHADPFGHPVVQAFLCFGRQLRVTRRDFQPLALALVAERIPLRLERRERDMFGRAQARPGHRAFTAGQARQFDAERGCGRGRRAVAVRNGRAGGRGARVEARIRGGKRHERRYRTSENNGQTALVAHPNDLPLSGRAKDTR
jgi:hypothetical protein